MIPPVARLAAVAVLIAGAGAAGVAAADSPAAPAAGAGGAASASDTAGTGATSGTGTAAGKHGARPGALLRQALHGEVVLRQRGGVRTVAVQRGEVTAATATAITVRSTDGFSRTYVLGASSRVRSGGQQADRTALVTGARVSVVAAKNGGTYTVTRVVVGRGDGGTRQGGRSRQAPAPATSGSPSA